LDITLIVLNWLFINLVIVRLHTLQIELLHQILLALRLILNRDIWLVLLLSRYLLTFRQ